MKTKLLFDAMVAADAAAAAHEKEIQETRKGGLGGSDAALVLRVGNGGLSALTTTDLKRLAVMCGDRLPASWGGNDATRAGHKFEDFAEQNLPFGKKYERERVLTASLATNFRVFAHADFCTTEESNYTVVECKYVQNDTDKVLEEYIAQLQWYYMLGAGNVQLYHGRGSVDPFEVEEGKLVEVGERPDIIRALKKGLLTLDEAIGNGWRPTVPEKITLDECPTIVQEAFAKLNRAKKIEEEMKDEKATAQSVIKQFFEDWELTGIIGNAENGEKARQVFYTPASVSKTFDSAKFLTDHPEFINEEAYWKQTKRASSVTFK